MFLDIYVICVDWCIDVVGVGDGGDCGVCWCGIISYDVVGIDGWFVNNICVGLVYIDIQVGI